MTCLQPLSWDVYRELLCIIVTQYGSGDVEPCRYVADASSVLSFLDKLCAFALDAITQEQAR